MKQKTCKTFGEALRLCYDLQDKIERLEYRLKMLQDLVKSPKSGMCKIHTQVTYTPGFPPKSGHIIEFSMSKAMPMIKAEIQIIKDEIKQEKKNFTERTKYDKELLRASSIKLPC
jgi:hypothetical protein